MEHNNLPRMNQHKTGDAFPNPRAQGDPRTLREISNRTPWIAGGAGEIHHIPGRTILTPARKARNVSSSSPLPLTLKKGTDVDEIQIIPGYVNLEMPTLGGTSLNHATPPEITVIADVWVWLKCVGTFGSPDTYVVTVETTTTATAPTGTTITATGFISFRPLGSVDFTAGSPATYDITNVHSGGNFGVDSFGNINLWWKA